MQFLSEFLTFPGPIGLDFRVATGSGTLRASSNGPIDPFGPLINAEGEPLASSDDDGSWRNFEIEATVAAGVHYVAVRGYGADVTGYRALSIEFIAAERAAPIEASSDIAVTAVQGGLTVSWEARAAKPIGDSPVLPYMAMVAPDDGIHSEAAGRGQNVLADKLPVGFERRGFRLPNVAFGAFGGETLR